MTDPKEAAPSQYVTVAEAREMLGVTRYKMTKMLKDSVLASVPNVADGRSQLILRADVEALMPRVKPLRHKVKA
jgi:hypothetical protein